MKEIVLITGGARSGKSRQALFLAGARKAKVFIATAEPFDEEMKARIEKHRLDRGESFRTVEAPLDPAAALLALPPGTEVAVLDCITVWLGNLMHRHGDAADHPEAAALLRVFDSPPCDVIVVSNEVGMGLVPETPLGRRFRDLAGRMNQEIARRASRMILMVSGIPVALKEARQ